MAPDCYTDAVAAQIDVLVVGGGILGLATSHCLLARRPGTSIVVLEKEPAIARHQTGRNSGVLHSGIYYKPGSLKAANCRVGKSAMERFCAEEGVPYEICGKVIVALDEAERPRLEALLERGIANGVRCERISRERLRELEPHAAGSRSAPRPRDGNRRLSAGVRTARGADRRARRKRGDRRAGRRVLQGREPNDGIDPGSASTTRESW